MNEGDETSVIHQPSSPCPIWPDYPASISRFGNRAAWRVESPRAGGRYVISEAAASHLRSGHLGVSFRDRTRALLTTRLIDHRRHTGRPLVVNQKVLEAATAFRPLQVADRAKRLLDYFVQWSPSPGRSFACCARPAVPSRLAAPLGSCPGPASAPSATASAATPSLGVVSARPLVVNRNAGSSRNAVASSWSGCRGEGDETAVHGDLQAPSSGVPGHAHLVVATGGHRRRPG